MLHRVNSAMVLLYLRSGLFLLLFAGSVVAYASFGLLSFPLSFRQRYRLLTTWGDLNVWLCARICGLTYRVEGLENIPERPSVVMASHQSTWETLVLKQFFPPLAWVVKRELMWIPFFGWGLAMIQPIVIDRRAGKKAFQQLEEQARDRLADGRWLLVFPQGTRVLPGSPSRYKLGGALVASRTGVPVIPVAHNAGDFWARHQFVKYPGTITVSIGPPVDSRGRSPETVNAQVKQWIDAKEAEIRSSSPVKSRLV
jgi:1-acyl-sn-glycerol-3-phosphate acyltransferase